MVSADGGNGALRISLLFRGLLLSDFFIDRNEVVTAMTAEADALGLTFSWDRDVYRHPAFRTLLDLVGITNGVTCLYEGASGNGTLVGHTEPPFDPLPFHQYLEIVRELGVWSRFVVLAFDPRSTSELPAVVHCGLGDFASLLGRSLDQARCAGTTPNTLYFLDV